MVSAQRLFRKETGIHPLSVTPRELGNVYRKYTKLVSDAHTDQNEIFTIRQLRELHHSLVETCSEFGEVFTRSFDFPYLVVMTNADGLVLYLCGDEWSQQRAAKDDLYLGSAVSMQDKGMSPFAIAMELQRPLYLERRERLVQTMQEWDAFLFPIRNHKKKIDAYVGFLFSDFTPGPGVGPFLQAIAMKMELQYADKCKQQTMARANSMNLEDKLFQFELTARERQVAAYWMLDYDYKQISKAIGISENTVRVVINKINNKLKVNSKASLILRVFDAI